MVVSRNFECFQYFNFTNFLEDKNLFQKTVKPFFFFKVLRLKTHHFHKKLSCQKPMLGQIEWWIQNGPTAKRGVLPVITIFFWNFFFSLRTSDKELISCTNYTNLNTGVLFEGAFSLWVSLNLRKCVQKNAFGGVVFL